MSEQITVPKIDETIIHAIETGTISTLAKETAAITLLRSRYTPIARHNGFIQTSAHSIRNYKEESYHKRDGKYVHALLALDAFDHRDHASDRNRGECYGCRLYLSQFGEWVETTRNGSWSNWQGEPQAWTGSIAVLTDAEVAEQYHLDQIVEQLAESLKTLAEKLPERLQGVQKRATLASQLLAALK